MKNIIKLLLSAVVLCTVFIQCVKYDDYKKYLEGGEIVYPQKPDSLKAYPGHNRIMLEWMLVDPKVVSCKVVYRQADQLDSLVIPINTTGEYSNELISVIVPDLQETSYTFTINTYDDSGHISIPVEIEESAYGDTYMQGIYTRLVKSLALTLQGLDINWFGGDESDVGTILRYTDKNGNPKKVTVPRQSNIISLDDIDIYEPFTYQTMYKPVTNAIDTFYTPIVQDRLDLDNYVPVLTNAQAPFQVTDRGLWVDGRFGTPVGWTINDAAGANGNVDNAYDRGLTMWAWDGYSPVGSITNGKVYQTHLISPGDYSFEATVKDISVALNEAYIVVALGEEMPDITDITTEALAYATVEKVPENDIIKCDFTITEVSMVTVGIVGNIDHTQQTIYKKFEIKKR